MFKNQYNVKIKQTVLITKRSFCFFNRVSIYQSMSCKYGQYIYSATEINSVHFFSILNVMSICKWSQKFRTLGASKFPNLLGLVI